MLSSHYKTHSFHAHFLICQLQIREGSSEFSPILLKPTCGADLPPVLQSEQNAMWIRFHSNSTGANATGFRAHYSSRIKGKSVCVHRLLFKYYGTSIILYSPLTKYMPELSHPWYTAQANLSWSVVNIIEGCVESRCALQV